MKFELNKKEVLVVVLLFIIVVSIVGNVNYVQGETNLSGPELSKKTSKSIIEIIKAEHLDSNRSFIADVYSYVSVLDDNWTTINNGEYLRVTFEENLTKERDITIYSRGNDSKIEVYEKDSDNLIVTFENVSENKKYKIYLTELNGTNNVFDLKVKNSDVEFDYVVDPASAYNMTFVPPTPANGTTTSNTSIEINVSIVADDLDGVIYNWNGANFTLFDDSLVLMMNFNNISFLGENDTYVVDLSEKGNNGTVTGALVNVTGKYGGAYEFDGIDDYVNITSSTAGDFNSNDNFTLEAWIKPTSSTTGAIISNENIAEKGYNLIFTEDRTITFIVGGTVESDMILELDAANTNSYPGSGTTWYDLGEDNYDFTLDGSGITFNSAGYFGLADGGATYSGSTATSTASTLVFWMTTTDTQALFWGTSGYVGAHRSGNKEYYGYCGSPDFYMDTVEKSNIYDYFRDGNWHMAEFKNTDLSGWTSGSFNNYGSYTFGDGNIAKILVYDRSLTATESQQNFNAVAYRFGLVNNATTTDTISLDTYSHILATKKGTNCSIYINGQLSQSFTCDISQNMTGNLQIGHRTSGVNEYFNGSIDEVRIWNRTLTTEEISQMYMSNLQKYNQTQWYLYVNQSKNAIDELDAGDYTYQVFAKDESGNLNYTKDRSITIQAAQVTIDLNSPANDTTIADVTPTLNITLINTADTAWYTTDFGATNTTICTSCSGEQIAFPHLAEGTYNIDVYANNSANDINSNTTQFTINMSENYYDSYNDNSSIAVYNDVTWNIGNARFTSISATGDGSDGVLTVSTANEIINNYTYLTGNELSGDAIITVNSGSEFSDGDEILIIQMQDGTGSGVSGNYEFRTISSGGGTTTLTLDSGLENTYGSGTFDADSASATQVVRIPQYTTVTINSGASITASAWNGYTGGIVVFKATGLVNVSGAINVSEKGYRGGLHGTPSSCGSGEGEQGESYPGKGSCGGYVLSGGEDPNGGGAGIEVTGGGGGYGTAGEDSESWNGGDPGAGGLQYGVANLTQIFLGSGGGGSYQGGSLSGDGGDGGGIIIIFANSVNVSGSVESKGQDGQGYGTGSYQYGTGGGSGGSIYISASDLSIGTDLTNASFGLGKEPPGAAPRDGGDGGVGRIRLDYNSLSGTTYPTYYEGTLSESTLDGNFISTAINTTQNITSITNVTWTESGTDANNNISVEVSSNNGVNWYSATSGQALGQTFTGANNSLVYKVLFVTNQIQTISLLDMNISWSEDAGASDTCTAPGSGNWAITCSDNCAWITDFTVPDNITISGSGTLTWNANMSFTRAHWEIYKEDGCELVINPGGSIR